MTTNKARLGAGNIDIVLEGQTLTLKPSLKAAMTLSRQQGGIAAAIEAVSRMNLDTIASVIALGTGETDVNDVAERVYRTGLASLAGPAIRYLSILANGGRPPEDTASGADEGNGASA